MIKQKPDYQDYQSYSYEEIPEDEMQTLYIYVSEKDLNHPRFTWPRFNAGKIVHRLIQILAIAMLSAFTLLPDMPTYTVTSITLPAIFLPLQHLQATTAIIPTGHKTIPATRATGLLTIYNGSFLNQSLPAGFIVSTHDGIEIMTDYAVTIPPENTSINPPSNGVASVQAHALLAGSQGNIQAGSINAVYGASLFIKNLAPFTDGRDSHTEEYATNQDKANALAKAQEQIQIEQAKLHQPGLFAGCKETDQQSSSHVTVTLACQYVSYHLPRSASNGKLLYVRLQGNAVIVTIQTVELPS